MEAEDDRNLALARSLHEYVGQQIATLLLGLRQLDQDDAPGTKLTVDSLHAIAQNIGHELYKVGLELGPTALEDFGLVHALTTYLQEWSLATMIPVQFAPASLKGGPVAKPIERTLFRVICAVLRDLSRSAGPTHVSIILHRQPSAVLAIIEDDAEMPARTRAERGNILATRTSLYGGTVKTERRPGGGGTTFVRLPVAAHSS